MKPDGAYLQPDSRGFVAICIACAVLAVFIVTTGTPV